MGRRVLRRVLRRGSKKGLSRRRLEGRSTPFREYDPVGVCPRKEPPTPKISALLRKRPVLRRANFVLTTEKKKAYTTTTERKSFGELFWPQKKTFRVSGGYKIPMKAGKTISTTEISPLWPPFFFWPKKVLHWSRAVYAFFFPVLRTRNGLTTNSFVVEYTGRGLVVKRPGVLSKVQILTLVLGVRVFSLLPKYTGCCLRKAPDPPRTGTQGSFLTPQHAQNAYFCSVLDHWAPIPI